MTMDREHAPVAGYGLVPPSRDDVMAFLARAVGADQAASVWVRACREAGVGAGARTLPPAEMLSVAEVLARQPGVVGVIGASLVVRLRSYQLLAAAHGRRGG